MDRPKETNVKAIPLALSTVLLFAVCTFGAARAQTASSAQGVETVEVIKATATVEKIDLEKRSVTLLLENGKHKTFKVDKSVQNLDQVKVGDRLKMSYTEELIIMVGNSNQTPAAASVGEVGLAPRGAKPGVVMAETTAVSAKILAVDVAKHSVTLEDPGGKKKTVKLGSKVTNLDQLKVGETVDMVMSDSLVIEIVK
jgi:Cu/Ag efflux protein CusF